MTVFSPLIGTPARVRDSLRWVPFLVAVAFFTGCAVTPSPKGSRFVVSTPYAEFFRNGPAQDFDNSQHTFANFVLTQYSGPDFRLPKGSSVTMMKRELGFSRVMTESGDVGYISNDQLKPAPVIARVVPTYTPAEHLFRSPTRANRPAPHVEEHLDMSDIPLPLPS